MDIAISDLVRRDYLQPFVISEMEVEEVIKNSDSKKELNFEDYHVMLCLKRMAKGHYLLVDARWADPRDSNLWVSSVFRIYPHTLEGVVDTHDPLQVLQHFAQEFGYTMVIGNQYNKYIYNAKFSIPKVKNKDELMKNIFSVIEIWGRKEKEKIDIDFVMNLEEGQHHDHINIGLAYVINNSKYIQYLNENDPGSVEIQKHFD